MLAPYTETMQFAFNSRRESSPAPANGGTEHDQRLDAAFAQVSGAGQDMLAQLQGDGSAIARQQLEGALSMPRTTTSERLISNVVALEGMKSCVGLMGADYERAQAQLNELQGSGGGSMSQRAQLSRAEREVDFARKAYMGQLGDMFRTYPEVRTLLTEAGGPLRSAPDVSRALEQAQLKAIDEGLEAAGPGDEHSRANLDKVRSSIKRTEVDGRIERSSALPENTAGHMTLTEQTAALSSALDPKAAELARSIDPTISEARRRVSQTAGPGAEDAGVAVVTRPEVNLLHTDGSENYMNRIHGLMGDSKIMMLPASGVSGIVAMQKNGQLDPSVVHELIHATQPVTGDLPDANLALHEGVTEALARRISAEDGGGFKGHEVANTGAYDQYTAYMNELVSQQTPNKDQQTQLLARMSRENAGIEVGKLGEILGSRRLTPGQQQQVLEMVNRDLVRSPSVDAAQGSAREMSYHLQKMQMPQLSSYETDPEQAVASDATSLGGFAR